MHSTFFFTDNLFIRINSSLIIVLYIITDIIKNSNEKNQILTVFLHVFPLGIGTRPFKTVIPIKNGHAIPVFYDSGGFIMKKYSLIAIGFLLALNLTACGRRNQMPDPTMTILPSMDPTLDTNIPDPEVDTKMPIYTDGTDPSDPSDPLSSTTPSARRSN
jgi:hypothetical protein